MTTRRTAMLDDVSDPADPARTVGRRRRGARAGLGMAGPAFVAAVAYVDPGNYATNVSAGAEYGYALVWVVIAANLMAIPVQYAAATLGIGTGRSLPDLCRTVMGRRSRVMMWLQAEVVAMATDVAEFLGAAVGLHLIFGLGLLPSGLITAVVAFGVLALQRRGHRPFELAIVAFLAFVVLAFVVQLASVGVDTGAAVAGLVPSFPDSGALVLAVGIVGATVMPHAVYAHSALTAHRAERTDPVEEGARDRLLRFQRTEVVVALALAGLVNLAIMLVAARVFGGVPGSGAADGLLEAHRGLAQLAGGVVALAFAAALLASGLSSAAVGTFAGQVVMAGFVSLRMPLLVRRTVTMLPALVLLALGVSPTAALVGSQVVLSFGIPFALYALLRVSRNRSLPSLSADGRPLVGRALTAVLGVVSVVVVLLNVVLLADTVGLLS